jgi:hypothetical protein
MAAAAPLDPPLHFPADTILRRDPQNILSVPQFSARFQLPLQAHPPNRATFPMNCLGGQLLPEFPLSA